MQSVASQIVRLEAYVAASCSRVQNGLRELAWRVYCLIIDHIHRDVSPTFQPASVEEVLQLQRVLQNTNPHHGPICLEKMRAEGMLPDLKYSIDNATYFCSRPRQFIGDENRLGIFVIVVVDGKAYPRILYCSKSQGIWRVLAEVVKLNPGAVDYQLGRFSKALAEVDTNVPLFLTGALCRMLEKDMALTTLNEEHLHAVGTTDIGSIAVSQEYVDQITRIYRETEPFASLVPRFERLGESDEPDFSTCVHQFSVRSCLYGDMTGRLYASINKQFYFLLYEITDPATSQEITSRRVMEKIRGLVFFAGYEVRGVNPVTSFGNRKRFCVLSLLDLPLFEYPGQIPRIVKSSGESLRVGSYVCAWNAVRENPYIKKYYESQGKPLPAAI